jgi:prepilin-type N-terminal cleavage/methylation domain-containing protein/prepilin-type processing-associated H-X9-DG protein
MKKKGFTLVELLVVIAIIAMLLAILLPALAKVRSLAYRVICSTNCSGLGKAMITYSQDYQEQYPVAGNSSTTWGSTFTYITSPATGWDAGTNPTFATGANICPISASLYLLVKYTDVPTGSFVCKASSQKKFELALANPATTNTTTVTDVTMCWNFGPCSTTGSNPWQFCSYSYQQPYKVSTTGVSYPINASSQPGLAVLADRNPWCDGTTYGNFTSPDTTSPPTVGPVMMLTSDFDSKWVLTNKTKAKYANSKAHGLDGQNVLYGDGHVSFETTPFVGIENDNIYTTWGTTAPQNTSIKEIGVQPNSYTSITGSISQSDTDSFLAN